MSHTRQPNQTLTSSTQVDSASELSQTSSITQVVTGTLRLRGERLANSTTQQQEEQRASGRRIRWGEDVIDNEGMGKKNSKGKGGFTASPTFPKYLLIITTTNTQSAVYITNRVPWTRVAPSPSPSLRILAPPRIPPVIVILTSVMGAREGSAVTTMSMATIHIRTNAILNLQVISRGDQKEGNRRESRVLTHMRRCQRTPDALRRITLK
jgi:hypothetical protein